jgi:hypothetical protein
MICGGINAKPGSETTARLAFPLLPGNGYFVCADSAVKQGHCNDVNALGKLCYINSGGRRLLVFDHLYTARVYDIYLFDQLMIPDQDFVHRGLGYGATPPSPLNETLRI